MDPGRRCRARVFRRESPEVARPISMSGKTWTNKYVDQGQETTGMNAK